MANWPKRKWNNEGGEAFGGVKNHDLCIYFVIPPDNYTIAILTRSVEVEYPSIKVKWAGVMVVAVSLILLLHRAGDMHFGQVISANWRNNYTTKYDHHALISTTTIGRTDNEIQRWILPPMFLQV